MVEFSNAEAALLGLLSEQDMHPYQIEQEVKNRDMRLWTDLSMSSIYKLLRKLEKEAYVTKKNQITPENRLQKIYTLSKKGLHALQAKLIEMLSIPEPMRWQIDIGLYNSHLLSGEQVRKALTAYRSELQNKIKGYHALLEFLKKSQCPEHRFALAKRPVFLLKSEINWIDSCLSAMDKVEKGGAE